MKQIVFLGDSDLRTTRWEALPASDSGFYMFKTPSIDVHLEIV